jgi:thiol-disulfide isomerase/thioredoxin
MAALVLLVTILVITGCGESSAQSPQIGKLSPGFTLYDLGDEAVSLSELKGKPVFINFWASWCGPCQEEMPLIQSIYERQAGQPQPAVILTINIGESLSTAENFMQEKGLSFPVLLDIEQSVAGDYNIRSIPTTLFIDSEGTTREIKIGAFTSVVQIERGLARLTQ